MMPDHSTLVPLERIESRILVLRGYRVMLSTHLAELYEVEPRTLVQAVKRNIVRFPGDFMFQLTWEEASVLKSQSAILKPGADSSSRSQSVTLKRGRNIKYLPYAFTEQGVAMLSSVLRSDRAVRVT
jgi:ORF6N domain